MTDLRLSIVVLSWNTRDVLRACLNALQRDVSAAEREIIVVDNGSSDGSAQMVARDFPSARLIRNATNELYAVANNQGARAARGRYLCLLNSDTEVRPPALERLAQFLEEHTEYAAIAPKLVNPDGTVQRACRRFPTILEPLLESTSLGRFPPGSWLSRWSNMGDFDHSYSRDVCQPPGACLLMRTAEYLEMGGLDPNLNLFFNDVDLCLALHRKGRRIRYFAEVEVMHHQGLSTRAHSSHDRNLLWIQNRSAYYRKNYGRLAEVWLHAVLRLWKLESKWRIRLGSRDASAKQSALAELDEFVRECSRR